ncbi:MAG: hypothetical protein M3P41_09385 [Actinomycetota bacterium]|nr:hypothetical protein [Actinomycetota bacterium]
MKRLVLIGIALAAFLPAAAPAAGCSPLSCASSGTPIGDGLLAVRPTGIGGSVKVVDVRAGTIKWTLPAGVFAGHVLVSKAHGTITWYDLRTGLKTQTADVAAGTWLVGVSQDGSRAVVQDFDKKTNITTFLVVTPDATKTIRLQRASWAFDALSGSNLYLLRYVKGGYQGGYQVRRYDVAAGKLFAKPLKDPHESSTIRGIPWARVSSPDGHWLFTLYLGSNGDSMVHELDLKHATARCVDLPGTGNFNLATSYAIELSHDGSTLWAVSPGYGRVAAIDVRSARVRVAWRFAHAEYAEAPAASISALSPDGSQLAVSVGSRLWFVQTATHAVVEAKPRNPLAIGYAPDGSKLWAVLNGGLVIALPVV